MTPRIIDTPSSAVKGALKDLRQGAKARDIERRRQREAKERERNLWAEIWGIPASAIR